MAFNLNKGSVPMRGDVDIDAANDCMKKGIEILGEGDNRLLRSNSCRPTRRDRSRICTPNSSPTAMTIEDAQERFVEIIATARMNEGDFSSPAAAGLAFPHRAAPRQHGSKCRQRSVPSVLLRNLNAKIAAVPMMLTVIVVFAGCTTLDGALFLHQFRARCQRSVSSALEQYERLCGTSRWNVSVENLSIYGVLSLIFRSS